MRFACPRSIYSDVADVQQAIVIGGAVGSGARQAVGFRCDGLALATAKQQGGQNKAQKQKTLPQKSRSLMQQGGLSRASLYFVYIT